MTFNTTWRCPEDRGFAKLSKLCLRTLKKPFLSATFKDRSTGDALSSETEEIAREQQYVAMLYDRLDALRERTATRFGQILREPGGTPQQRTERDTAAAEQVDR